MLQNVATVVVFAASAAAVVVDGDDIAVSFS